MSFRQPPPAPAGSEIGLRRDGCADTRHATVDVFDHSISGGSMSALSIPGSSRHLGVAVLAAGSAILLGGSVAILAFGAGLVAGALFLRDRQRRRLLSSCRCRKGHIELADGCTFRDLRPRLQHRPRWFVITDTTGRRWHARFWGFVSVARWERAWRQDGIAPTIEFSRDSLGTAVIRAPGASVLFDALVTDPDDPNPAVRVAPMTGWYGS
jgi:hypothetical protein